MGVYQVARLLAIKRQTSHFKRFEAAGSSALCGRHRQRYRTAICKTDPFIWQRVNQFFYGMDNGALKLDTVAGLRALVQILLCFIFICFIL